MANLTFIWIISFADIKTFRNFNSVVIQHLYTVKIGNEIANEHKKQIFLKELVLTAVFTIWSLHVITELFIACFMDVYSSKFASA